ncbi:hypothetical protein H5410_052679 [Solanum commersonii]|uniref:Uncharacterized protein n=1 Tax=Solanum commersonii TaxID=4109 RepID=A0A9J5X430_SOLCO|nr:hypothetical protein H5410_052679 [Solanum commersonii]
MLNELPQVVSGYKNEELQEMAMKEEVRSAVEGLNQHKASGPNGMTMVFYQRLHIKIRPCGKLEEMDLKCGKNMLQARDLVEHQILWQTMNGSASLWHDNWIGIGNLYTIAGDNFAWDDRYEKVMELANQRATGVRYENNE